METEIKESLSNEGLIKAPIFRRESRKQNVCLCDKCPERYHDYWCDTERCGFAKGVQLHGLYFSGYYIPFRTCPKNGEVIIKQENN